ncbi:protein arginine N-methyltransferase 2-like [Diadema antillarum]|uniref:protein arginine N-methyltransferase 2-like n=1 Tax=Diadema antillarum TaxID=105358 RepID=UPI003A8BC734
MGDEVEDEASLVSINSINIDSNGDVPASGNGKCSEIDDSDVLEIVTALADFSAKDDTQLSFESGQLLSVLCKTTGHWWWARKGSVTGYIPTNHVTTKPPHSSITKPDWQDEEYFGSYSTLKLQQEMLSDTARNEAYFNAIVKNKKFLEGKVVLDVGCGTGFLSMLCAKHGAAKQVYSIEASEIAETAKSLVEHNHLSDRIQVFHGKVEGVTLPEKVDLIISEWMGTLLIFEFMIESVIIARDKWLKDDGRMWPSQAHLTLAPISAPKQQERIAFWDSVCDLDYSSLKAAAKSEYFCKPLINEKLEPGDILSEPAVIFTFDLCKLTVQQLEAIKMEFSFRVTTPGTFHGFGSWFSVDFASLDDGLDDHVVLDTGPKSALTHWKQAVFILDDWYDLMKGDVVVGTMMMERSHLWRRHFKVRLSGKIRLFSSMQEKVFDKTFGVWR